MGRTDQRSEAVSLSERVSPPLLKIEMVMRCSNYQEPPPSLLGAPLWPVDARHTRVVRLQALSSTGLR
jgi:hypothetical protein